jgi:hypothetical protein
MFPGLPWESKQRAGVCTTTNCGVADRQISPMYLLVFFRTAQISCIDSLAGASTLFKKLQIFAIYPKATLCKIDFQTENLDLFESRI